LSSEGTSQGNQTTHYGRGTSGYRAPELIVSEGNPTYNNKVDIWSLGCVLYELATGKRAFNNDWVVLKHRYERKNKEVILDDRFDAETKEIITKHIVDMLQIESSVRPSATVLSKEFSRLPVAPVARLHNAAGIGDIDTIKALIRGQVDVNSPFPEGQFGNALQAAAYVGSEEIVRLLLKNGANVNAKGGYYGTALQAASFDGDELIVRLLLENGANINARGGRYGNALQAASYLGQKEVVRLLLQNGAEVNAPGGKYGSAIRAARRKDRYDVVQLLLENGAEDKDDI
jgi:ankyrin repeat protein